MNKEFDYNVLDEILKEHNYDESHTVTILQEVQAHYSYSCSFQRDGHFRRK